MEEELIKRFEQEGFISHNGIQVEEISENKVVMKVILEEKSKNPYGIAHGGLIFSLGDTAMGVLARMQGKDGVTLNSTIDFLRPGVGEYLIATAEMVKPGNKISVLKATITADQKKLVAIMNVTYYYND